MSFQLIIFAFAYCFLVSFGQDMKFYIYEWDPNLQSSWPVPGTPDYKIGKAEHYKADNAVNFGNGPAIDASLGLYQSVCFQYYSMVMSKLRVHPRRTFNRSEAGIFVVPYDIGVAAQWIKETGKYSAHQIDGCMPEGPKVVKLLRREIGRSGMLGHDHLIINSLYGTFCKDCFKILLECQNCTIIDNDNTNSRDHFSQKYARDMGIPFSRRWYAVPFTSSYHWNEAIVSLPWTQRPTRNIQRETETPEYLVAMWASHRVQNHAASHLRKALQRQCADRPTQCILVDVVHRNQNQCLSKSSNSSSSNSNSNSDGTLSGAGITSSTSSSSSSSSSSVSSSISHSAACALLDKHSNSSMSGLEAYNSSVFCLQPPGDMESRKGVFDSLMSGCIPVIFNKDMLSINYPWFFPPLNGDHSSNSTLGGMDTANAGIITSHNATSAAAVSHTLADELAVFVSHSMKFDKQFNIVDHLSKIPPEVIRAKQKAIEKFAPTMNYAIPPARFKPFIGHAGGPGVRLPQQKSDFWRPPFRDAVDVILDRMESTVSRFSTTHTVPPEDMPELRSQWEVLWAGQ